MRLARLTGRPNQSPARGSAGPSAAPARSWGKSSPSASAASISRASPRAAARARRGEHRGVADRLDQPHGRLGDVGRERFQAHRQAPELVGRDFLAEAREADQVGEADGHLARAGQLPAAALHRADHLALRGMAQVQGEHVADHRVDQRVELRRRLAVAAGEVALADPGLEDEFQRQHPQALGGLGEPAAEHAQEIEDVLVGDAGFAPEHDAPGGLELGLGVDGLVRLGDRQSHRAAGGHQEVGARHR